jgi:hypothetical protein
MYPHPRFDTVIEPFAGGAGYALRHWRKRVILIERSPDVCGAWRMILERGPDAIRSLPLFDLDTDVRTLGLDEDEQRLIGFWLNSGTARPCNQFCSWAKQRERSIKGSSASMFWSTRTRERLARMSELLITRWSIIEGDYDAAPDEEATWFVDPPYQGDLGDHYWGKNELDYPRLAEWCRSRRGQVIVCERHGADWMPFERLGTVRATPGRHRRGTAREAMWTSTGERSQLQLDMWGDPEA